MAKPDIRLILRNASRIEDMDDPGRKAFSKALYHAFYYHNQGWLYIPDNIIADLVHALIKVKYFLNKTFEDWYAKYKIND